MSLGGADGFGEMIMFFLFLSFIFFIIHIAICVWAYRDAIRKGRSQEFALLVLLALFFFPVIGFIVYLFIRNDTTHSRYR
ncbi:PLDc N-terminal domain-containing protein [Cohnella yongneupensis]|uniref:PLDc N-terminal domain-containing protein n=1 Tax=Cohnella yongneupensis TaxID=425006 RepID=A0ABW0R603_9BACL